MNGHLELKNLRKVFRTDDTEVVAIDDISLDVAKGELVSLIGPSGCGKTTVLRMVAGLQEPTSGKIVLQGREVQGPGSDRGMVFQEFALFPWRSVRRNVEFGLEIAGVPKEERRKKVERYLDVVGLERFADARIHELSGGMKQRVGIARAMVNNPDVLLMDEPFGALDAQTRNIMQGELLKILAKTSKTILFVTHSVDEALYLSDRIIMLSKRPGRIKTIIEVPWPRPRDRAAPEFAALRKQILSELEKENVMDD
ncbi:MAG: ABC transporter ATP-binding protein [Candidatus Methanomethylophilaceae archaeon]|nr:ABC transporter ATP-binding protein [Clostridia bacterium]